jgi:hypothetical protein
VVIANVKERMMECPNIDKNILQNIYNVRINYKDLGGPTDYIFYDHIDPDGVITRVQFCKKIGRKKDIFECLNENEWKECPYYRIKI